MIEDIIQIILSTAENAFLQVGVFVGAVLLLFGFINYKRQGKFVESLEKSKKWQPIFGAFLGLTPGCGVLISTHPEMYLWVSIICFAVAIVVGYIVDKMKVDEGFITRKKILIKNLQPIKEQHDQLEKKLVEQGIHQQNMSHIAHKEGDIVDVVFHHKEKSAIEKPWAHIFTHKYAYIIFWILVAVAITPGIALLFQIDVNTWFGIPHLGTILGISGTVFSAVYMFINRKIVKNDEYEEEESKIFSLKETLIHSAEDTAFVNTWVFVAYFLYEIAVYALGGEMVVKDWMTATGGSSIWLGALIGLIPGCGPQIIFVSLFAKGMIPFSALLANAISQDGDALFPLLAIDKKSSLIATAITTVPALVLGLILYYVFGV